MHPRLISHAEQDTSGQDKRLTKEFEHASMRHVRMHLSYSRGRLEHQNLELIAARGTARALYRMAHFCAARIEARQFFSLSPPPSVRSICVAPATHGRRRGICSASRVYNSAVRFRAHNTNAREVSQVRVISEIERREPALPPRMTEWSVCVWGSL